MAIMASVVCSADQSWPPADEQGAENERWALLSLHRDRAVALLRSRGVSAEDAEDSVHDALLQLMAHPALDHGRVGSLLGVVAMRRAYDRQRVRTREHNALRRLGRLGDVPVSPADTALDRVEAQWLAGQVAELPVRQRQVVAGHAVGFSGVETARILGITSKAAECALSRARMTLRAVAGGVALAGLWLLRRAHGVSTAAPAAAATVAVGLLATASPTAAHASVALPDDEQGTTHVVMAAHAIPPELSGDGSAHTLGALTPAVPPRVPHGSGPSANPAPPPSRSLGLNSLGSRTDGADNTVSVQHHSDGQTFTQSLTACVAQGVSLNTHALGCPSR